MSGETEDRKSLPHSIAKLTVPVTARTVIDSSFHSDGTAELTYVYDLGIAVGLPEQTVRLAIRRLQAAGLLVQEGRGRAGRLVLQEAGIVRAKNDARLVEFSFALDRGEAPWDGRWHLYNFNIPESHRSERDALRTALTDLGAAAISPGCYVSPHALWHELKSVMPEPILLQRMTVAEITSLKVPGCDGDADIAERFWPAKEVCHGYDLLEQLLDSETPPEGTSPADVAASAVRLAQALEAALVRDPLLPPELREQPWKPARVRARFLERWKTLKAYAPEVPLFTGPYGSI